MPDGTIDDLRVKYQTGGDTKASMDLLYSMYRHSAQMGDLLYKIPILDGKVLDVVELFSKTIERGGYIEVDGAKPPLWGQVCLSMGIHDAHGFSVQQFYSKYLKVYESMWRQQNLKYNLQSCPQTFYLSPGALEIQKNKALLQAAKKQRVAGPTSTPSTAGSAPATGPVSVATAHIIGGPNPPPATATTTTGGGSTSYSNANMPRPLVGQGDGRKTPLDSASTAPTSSTGAGKAPVSSHTLRNYPEPPTGVLAIVTDTSMTWPEKIAMAIKDLDSSDIYYVLRGLNLLTVKSYDADPNSALMIDAYPELVVALGSLLDAINPLGLTLLPPVRGEEDADFKYAKFLLDESRDFNWSPTLPCKGNDVFKALAATVDSNELLLSTLNIIRNLTFEVANETLLSYSSALLRHMTALLVGALETGKFYEASQMAFDIISNLSGRLDLSGTRRLRHSYWLEDPSNDPRGKSLLRTRMSSHMAENTAREYVDAAHALLAYILESLKQTDDRTQVLRGLELLTKLVAATDNIPVLERSPHDLFEVLVELLCVGTTSSEPLVASSSTTNSGPARPPACGGSFFSDLCDTEIRDQAIEAIWTLCTASEALRINFAAVPEIVKILLRIVEASAPVAVSATSEVRIRSEVILKASHILAWMAKLPAENGPKFMSLQTEMLVMSCSDELVAEVVCSSAAPIFKPVRAVQAAVESVPSNVSAY